MFRKSVTISALAISSLLIWGTLKLCVITDKELAKYTTILSDYNKMSSESIAETATQSRLGVRKDLWFSQQDKSRLSYRIESDSSLLTLDSSSGKLDVKENLLNIKCWMQEKLSGSGASSMQQVRFLEAKNGIYFVNKQKFLADSVALSLFRLPGHELIIPSDKNKSFLKGKAADISFSVSGKTPKFEANQFTASLSQENNKK